jgi:hypothetical protein
MQYRQAARNFLTLRRVVVQYLLCYWRHTTHGQTRMDAAGIDGLLRLLRPTAHQSHHHGRHAHPPPVQDETRPEARIWNFLWSPQTMAWWRR